LGSQKFLADNNYGPAGDRFYDFQKEHQTVQELKKQVTELAAEEGQSILSIIRRDEQDRKARRIGGGKEEE
jgi:CRISPR/Cas system-associated endoribonuclease Cas2